ncbi:MAG: hypothetical protein ACTSRY_07020, partial [Alphaproteobacteria bacterium]
MAVRETGWQLKVDVPYDIESYAAGAVPCWPVARGEVAALNRDLQHKLVALARETSGAETAASFVAALPQLLSQTLSLAQAGLSAARAREAGTEFVFSGPSLVAHFLDGRRPGDALIGGRFLARLARALDPDRLGPLRRAAHGFLANRGPGLPWRPTTAILNRTHLLSATLGFEVGRRFRFETPARLFRGSAPAPAGPAARALDEAA